MANIEHAVPVSDDTLFSVNNIVQAFAGIALLQLVEEGKLVLDFPVCEYLTDLPTHWRSVTVRQIASFTSGLPEIVAYARGDSICLIGDGTEDSAWEAAYALPLQAQPGEHYQFTRSNYALVGKLIQHLTGQSFDQFVTERQFIAAGLRSTAFSNDRDILKGRADTYAVINPNGSIAHEMFKSQLNWPPALKAVSGLHSTARDLACWLAGLKTRRLLSSPSSIETMWEPTKLYDGSCGPWSIGWPVAMAAEGKVLAPSGGCKAQLALYPDGLSLILLTNLIGAFPEQLAAYSNVPIDLKFMDDIASFYR